MAVLANTIRFSLPLLACGGAYLVSPQQGEVDPHGLTLCPPPQVALWVTLTLAVVLGIAWALGAPRNSKDLTYFILAVVLAGGMLANRLDMKPYRQMLINVALFIVAFLLYSASGGCTAERVLLGLVVAVLLVEMVLSIQATQAALSPAFWETLVNPLLAAA